MWKKSVIEGAKCAVIAFAIVEFIGENVTGWTGELLEYVWVYPDTPNVLHFYIEIQIHKLPIALIIFLIILGAFSWKYNVEINRWHLLGIIPSSVGYGFYLAVKYFLIFPAT